MLRRSGAPPARSSPRTSADQPPGARRPVAITTTLSHRGRRGLRAEARRGSNTQGAQLTPAPRRDQDLPARRAHGGSRAAVSELTGDGAGDTGGKPGTRRLFGRGAWPSARSNRTSWMDPHLPSTSLAPSVKDAQSDDSRLPRTVYRLTRRLDNASLRFLDAGVILVAWLVAYLAGFEGSRSGRSPWRPAPVPRAARSSPSSSRTSSPVCTARSGATRRSKKRRGSSSRSRGGAIASTIELIVLDRFSDTTVAGVHDAAGRGVARPARLRRYPLPSTSVRTRTPTRNQVR